MQGDHQSDLKQLVLDLINDLRDNVFVSQQEQNELLIAEFFFKRLHKGRVMQHVLDKIVPWKDMIYDRNLEFFLDHNTIFEKLPSERVSYYSRKIASKEGITDEDIDTLWEYLDSMIAVAEAHKKIK